MTKFEFISFSRVVNARGQAAALMDITENGISKHGWVWMSKENVETNIKNYGKCSELEKALNAYEATDKYVDLTGKYVAA